jgi:hypothetical protein
MKIPSTQYRFLAAIFVFSIVIFSCKKETSDTLSAQDEEQANVAATQSDTEAESVFDGIFNDALGVNGDVAMGGTGIFGRVSAANYGTFNISGRVDNVNQLPPCLNVTIEHTSTTNLTFPVKVTLDFGSTGCIANDGHWRKGKIIIVYTNRLLYPGAVAEAGFEDFYIDSIRIDNSTSFRIANTGTTSQLQLTVDVNGKLSKPNGNYSEWHSHKQITRTAGNATTTPIDDIFKIEGKASGKVKRNDLGVAWNAVITDPLIKQFSCRYISKGVVSITRETLAANSKWTGTLDYGQGNCDKFAILKVNGREIQITLR